MENLAQNLFTEEEYLERERKAHSKSEYYKGEIFAIAGATRNHNLLVTNLCREISSALRGKPCIKGHRIWVSLILDYLAIGTTFQQIKENYPGLEELDIYACTAYGAEMSRERFVDILITV